MKKFVSVFLCIALLAGLVTAFSVGTAADDTDTLLDQFFVMAKNDYDPCVDADFAARTGADTVEVYKDNIYTVKLKTAGEENVYAAIRQSFKTDGVLFAQPRNRAYLNPVDSALPDYDAASILVRCPQGITPQDILTQIHASRYKEFNMHLTNHLIPGDGGEKDSFSGVWYQVFLSEPENFSVFDAIEYVAAHTDFDARLNPKVSEISPSERSIMVCTLTDLESGAYCIDYESFELVEFRWNLDWAFVYKLTLRQSGMENVQSAIRQILQQDCNVFFADYLYEAAAAAPESCVAPMKMMDDQFFVTLRSGVELPEGFAEQIGAETVTLHSAIGNVYLAKVFAADTLYDVMKKTSALDIVANVQGRDREYLNPVGPGLPYCDARTVLVKYTADADIESVCARVGCIDSGETVSDWHKWTVTDPVNVSVFNVVEALRGCSQIEAAQLCETDAYRVDNTSILIRTDDVLWEYPLDCLDADICFDYKDGPMGTYLYRVYLYTSDLFSVWAVLNEIRELDDHLIWADMVRLEPVQDEKYHVDWYKEYGEYPEKEGVYFGGWYADAACTVPFMEKSGFAYARFVDQDVFKLGFQVRRGTTKESERTDLRLITTVDRLDYQYIRFYVDSWDWLFDDFQYVSEQTTTVYNRLLGMDGDTVMTYTPSMFSPSSKYFAALTIKNLRLNDFLDFVVSWMTADGTLVSAEKKSCYVSSLVK